MRMTALWIRIVTLMHALVVVIVVIIIVIIITIKLIIHIITLLLLALSIYIFEIYFNVFNCKYINNLAVNMCIMCIVNLCI